MLRTPQRDATLPIDVWRFEAAESGPERFTVGIPVRVGDERVGEIDLGEVFRRF